MILITGGAGYVGRHLALACRDAGLACAVLDDLSTGDRDALPADMPLARATVEDEDAVREVLRAFRPRVVVHLAALISVTESFARPERYHAVNVGGTLAVARACLGEGVGRLVFASTAAVYGVPPDGTVTETSPVDPVSPYGRSKLAAEWGLADIAATGRLATTALRFFNVAGADPWGRAGPGPPDAPHLLAAVARVARGAQDRLEVFGDDYETRDGTCIRDFVHVSDLCDAILLACGGAADGVGCLNVGSGRGASVAEVLRAAEGATGAPIPRIVRPRRSGDVPAIVARADGLLALGWRPRLSTPRSIVETALGAAVGDGARRRPLAG